MNTGAKLLDLLPLVVLRLTSATEDLHAGRGLTTAMRSLLVSIDASGPDTVSAMAAHRRVSRQYIQRVCDELVARGLAKPQANPRHQRSPLMALTARGRKTCAEIRAAEAPHVTTLLAGLQHDDVETTIQVLATLARRLEGDLEAPVDADNVATEA